MLDLTFQEKTLVKALLNRAAWEIKNSHSDYPLRDKQETLLIQELLKKLERS